MRPGFSLCSHLGFDHALTSHFTCCLGWGAFTVTERRHRDAHPRQTYQLSYIKRVCIASVSLGKVKLWFDCSLTLNTEIFLKYLYSKLPVMLCAGSSVGCLHGLSCMIYKQKL